MALAPGMRLGRYEISSQIGAGGMGEVYRARDLDLKRDVAIKVLPAMFAADAERLGRLQREAEVLASLNHPNIAAIYGLERSEGTIALVMELVEGPTLADRIARGPVPADEALPIARQTAEALEAAHDRGIIHRDLKPANIKVRDDGTVKVLDFGLAKAVESASGVLVTPQSPTLTRPMETQAGVLLGTAAYMSPEQARGKAVDQRADIWAFGCVLFELLTGKQAFEGDTVSDRFASILRAEPPWSSLPPVPSAVRWLLQQCLRKDARRRLQHIGDARIVLEDGAGSEALLSTPAPRRAGIQPAVWKAATMILLLVALALAALLIFRAPPAETRVTQFVVPPPEGGAFESGIGGAQNWPFPALSPDGGRLAFTARDASRGVMLWVRSFDADAPQALPGTEGAGAPFWAADSQSIAFFAKGKLKRVELAGGPVQEVCEASAVARGGTWNRDGLILFAPTNGGPIHRVPATGGRSEAVTALADGQTSHRAPVFLPDGRHFFFYAVGRADVSGLYLGDLDARSFVRLSISAESTAVYSPSGHVLFTRQGILFYQPFDMRRLALGGEPRSVAANVAFFGIGGLTAFSVSEKGDLSYWPNPAAPDGQLTWVDRAGDVIEQVGPPGNYRGVDLSRDGKLLVHRHDANGGDIYLVESARAPMRKLTFDATQHNSSPIWSTDGSDFAFQSLRQGKWGIYRKRAVGAGDEERIFEADINTVPQAWSPDRQSILFWWLQGGSSLWSVAVSGPGKPVLVGGNWSGAQPSPDGKWLLYHSVEKGASEVYLQPMGSPERRLQVSPNGGIFPRWRADGSEFFFVSTLDRKLVAVSVKWLSGGADVSTGNPTELFDIRAGGANVGHTGGPFHYYAVSRDGQRFLVPRPLLPGADAVPPITVIQNWSAHIGR